MSDRGEKKKNTFWFPLIVGVLMVIMSLTLRQFLDKYPQTIFYVLGPQMTLFRYIACPWIWKLSRLQNRNPLGDSILAAYFPAIMLIAQSPKPIKGPEERSDPFPGERLEPLNKILKEVLALIIINWVLSLVFVPIGRSIPPTGSLPTLLEIHLYWGMYFLFLLPMIALTISLLLGAIPFKQRPYSSRVTHIASYLLLGLNIAHLVLVSLFPLGVFH